MEYYTVFVVVHILIHFSGNLIVRMTFSKKPHLIRSYALVVMSAFSIAYPTCISLGLSLQIMMHFICKNYVVRNESARDKYMHFEMPR